VNMRYQKMLNEGVSPVQAAKESGDATRNWLHTKTGTKATVDTAARQELKQSTSTLPKANARAKTTYSPEPDDVSSVIAEMRRGRPGQGF
jgi:hypothetical protein